MLELEQYQDEAGRVPFAAWLAGLKDRSGKARIIKRLARLRAGLWGDAKPVGGGVIELREAHGPGYRLYLAKHGEQLVILLAGGNKSTQRKDIEHAQCYWKDWKARQGG